MNNLSDILEALKTNCMNDIVWCIDMDNHNHVLCNSLDAAKAIQCLFETLTNDTFEIYYHDADFTEDMGLQDTYEVYKVVDGNSGHWDGVD